MRKEEDRYYRGSSCKYKLITHIEIKDSSFIYTPEGMYFSELTINNYLFANSCTASIYDNEIINIFNSINEIKTEDLIKSIIEIGGKKAECFSDDFRLYTNIGFMPISVCKWDDRLASKKWLYLNHMIDKNGNIIQELINNSNYKLKVPRLDKIFFIYTGTKINISYNDWVQKVTYSENYTEAKTKRDNIYRKLMEEKLNG
jgi:hypothetical protein